MKKTNKLISNLKIEIKKCLSETRAQKSEWSTLYLLIIVAIVAVVLLAVIKPLFNRSMTYSVKKSALPSQSVSS
ncbi:MAG: hypothetical protein V1824_00035 [archaeon]